MRTRPPRTQLAYANGAGVSVASAPYLITQVHSLFRKNRELIVEVGESKAGNKALATANETLTAEVTAAPVMND